MDFKSTPSSLIFIEFLSIIIKYVYSHYSVMTVKSEHTFQIHMFNIGYFVSHSMIHFIECVFIFGNIVQPHSTYKTCFIF